MKKYVITLFVVLFFDCESFTQKKPFVQVIQERLDAYYSNNLPVKVQIIFNQPQYVAGDTAYFSVHFLWAINNGPVLGKQIINIDLVNDEGDILLHLKVQVKDGLGHNQLALPFSIGPGSYTMIAYSDWMKNQHPSLFGYENLIVGGERQRQNITTQPRGAYPEGGSLVQSVTNKVVLSGPANSQGYIKNSQEEIITAFNTNSYGLSVLYFVPLPNQKYYAVWHSGEKIPLPLPVKDKASMLLTIKVQERQARMVIQVADTTVFKEPMHLIISKQSQVYYSATLSFKNNSQALVTFPFDKIPGGIANATLFTESGEVMAERVLLIDQGNIIKTEIDIDQDVYSFRDKVDMQLRIEKDGLSAPALYSVTVYQQDLFADSTNVYASLHMDKTDLGFSHLFNVNLPAEAINDYLITKTWKRFSWTDVWHETIKDKFKFKESIYFTGTAYFGDTNQNVPDSTSLTFFLINDVMVYQTYTDAQGRFDFPLLISFFGEEQVYYAAQHKKQPLQGVRIELENNKKHVLPSVKNYFINQKNPYFLFSQQTRKIDDVYQFFSKNDKLKDVVNPHALIEEEIFGADITIQLSDYLLFPSMEETLREVVPSVQHRKIGKKNMVRIYFTDRDMLAKGDPMFIIDGVISDDADYFLALKPENVSTLKVVHTVDKLKSFGALGENGIILIETKIANNKVNVPMSKNRFIAKGLTAPKAFNYINYKGRATDRTPCFRSNVFWSPNIRDGVPISFETPDNPGTFKIVVNGLTDDGIPFYVEKLFKVDFIK